MLSLFERTFCLVFPEPSSTNHNLDAAGCSTSNSVTALLASQPLHSEANDDIIDQGGEAGSLLHNANSTQDNPDVEHPDSEPTFIMSPAQQAASRQQVLRERYGSSLSLISEESEVESEDKDDGSQGEESGEENHNVQYSSVDGAQESMI